LKKILGIDPGRSRTGVAISDLTHSLSSPLTVIHEKNNERLVEKIAEIVAKENIELIVMGLPKNMDGTEGDSAKNSRALGTAIVAKTNLEVIFQDERGSTISANAALDLTGKKNRKKIIDAVAATIILQEYLDSKKQKL